MTDNSAVQDWECIETQSVDGMTLEISYSPLKHQFKVAVEKAGVVKEQCFEASFEPIFGMDVGDSGTAYALAESLAQQLDIEVK
ncbi:MAG: hypothetical protein LRZ85_09810 [Alphaproteobacteria bacterium]|nr:hypothetical protein [Alphaproteobacteria bacterium]MCD8520465.1 hypothetical protein [Alphaproteobacteria bacterium]MCD8571158.1 hypothetical protein [Alphaproteobacteria bacterium]